MQPRIYETSQGVGPITESWSYRCPLIEWTIPFPLDTIRQRRREASLTDQQGHLLAFVRAVPPTDNPFVRERGKAATGSLVPQEILIIDQVEKSSSGHSTRHRAPFRTFTHHTRMTSACRRYSCKVKQACLTALAILVPNLPTPCLKPLPHDDIRSEDRPFRKR